jgi:hypothetical protein
MVNEMRDIVGRIIAEKCRTFSTFYESLAVAVLTTIFRV